MALNAEAGVLADQAPGDGNPTLLTQASCYIQVVASHAEEALGFNVTGSAARHDNQAERAGCAVKEKAKLTLEAGALISTVGAPWHRVVAGLANK